MTDAPKPNLKAAWTFLERMHRGRPRVVTGIDLSRKYVPTETFGIAGAKDFAAWAKAAGETCNLYFSVGEPMGPTTKKLERTQIKAVHWLHVDVDPAKGADIAQERARILAMLQSPSALPPPTVIVDSGGGYQAYWQLSAPIEVNGKLDCAEDAALYNLFIERILGGDHCHNIDRIMRLPGTVNMPDEKKRQRGRVPVLACVVEDHPDRIYDLSAFQRGVREQSNADGDRSVKPPPNAKRLKTVDDLGSNVKEAVKIYIVQGAHPDEPHKFQSRSELVFWVACELVRADVPDEVVYSVLTDERFKVSESVIERADATAYAMRQVRRARENAIDPMLCDLNERHAVIENLGGRCIIIEEMWEEIIDRQRITKQSFTDFRTRYMNKFVQVGSNKRGAIEMAAGEWWLKHPKRRTYQTMGFAPGKDIPGVYNLWRGYGCDPRPGDCSLFLNHIRDIVCAGEDHHYQYMLNWMAYAVQKPSEPGHSAIVMRGKQGAGKSIVPRLFGRLFGRHFLAVTRPEHLVGNFNAHLRDCVLLFADEAFFAGDKRHENVLKTIVTEPTLTIEQKGVDSEQTANCIHLMMASNEKWVIPAGPDDRRYFVLDVSAERRGDHNYFRAMADQMELHGGKEALLHMLLAMDLKAFNIRSVPRTKALADQKALSMDSIAEWYLTALRRGTPYLELQDWPEYASVDMMRADYLLYSRATGVERRSSETRFGLAMKEMIPNAKKIQRACPIELRMVDGSKRTIDRPLYFKMPNLDECREHFDQNFGGPYEWENDLPDQALPVYAKHEVMAAETTAIGAGASEVNGLPF